MSKLIDRISTFNAGRDEKLVGIKYQKMREDEFAFFRGTCHLFYEDLPAKSSLDDAPLIWACGDLHLQNFGIYQGDDGLIYFDVNDFDESLRAPATWDLIRFLTSMVLGLPGEKSVKRDLMSRFLDSYAAALAKGQMRAMHTAVAAPALSRVMQKRQQRSRVALLNDYTRTKKKARRFKTRGRKMRALDEEHCEKAVTLLQSWSLQQPDPDQYAVREVASRLSGLGSMGVERYLFLAEGQGAPNKHRLLEIKQRLMPAPQPYAPRHQPHWSSAAERVVALQSRLQAVPPAPLVALAQAGTSYTLRELFPADTKVDLEEFDNEDACNALIAAMGTITACAHLRGCGRQHAAGIDALIRFAAGPGWRKPVLDYAWEYSQQVRADYKTFCASDLGV